MDQGGTELCSRGRADLGGGGFAGSGRCRLGGRAAGCAALRCRPAAKSCKLELSSRLRGGGGGANSDQESLLSMCESSAPAPSCRHARRQQAGYAAAAALLAKWRARPSPPQSPRLHSNPSLALPSTFFPYPYADCNWVSTSPRRVVPPAPPQYRRRSTVTMCLPSRTAPLPSRHHPLQYRLIPPYSPASGLTTGGGDEYGVWRY